MVNWFGKKASSLRASWKKRLTKYSEDSSVLPSSEEIKKWLYEHYPFTCEYDNIELVESEVGFDHDVPIARGGSFGLENIVICHKLHNSAKGELTGTEYKQLLEVIRKWEDRGEKFLTRLRQSNTIFIKRKRKR